MKASLAIEAIGDDTELAARFHASRLSIVVGRRLAHALFDDAPRRSWCAEIIGHDPRYGYARRFLSCKRDYRTANSVGSRGVYKYYILESGHIYEVSSPLSWRKVDRYFCRVADDGSIIRLSQDEVDACLQRS